MSVIDGVKVYDNEIYNDSDFYEQLLKEYVMTATLGSRINVKTKLKRTKNQSVDVKASKGRRIRYNVHEKLVTFVAPQPHFTSLNVDQLMKSLFT